jgi:hypothetical protein
MGGPSGASVPCRFFCSDLRQGGAGNSPKQSRFQTGTRTQTRQKYREHGIHIGVVEIGDGKKLIEQRDHVDKAILVPWMWHGDEYNPNPMRS